MTVLLLLIRHANYSAILQHRQQLVYTMMFTPPKVLNIDVVGPADLTVVQHLREHADIRNNRRVSPRSFQASGDFV
jgi:hypothetical protein